MQERRRLPDGFLLMLLSHHFVVAFLVLTTFVVESAVYNFMQTQKERQPCKIKASAINKKSARRRTRSGGPRTARTGAERRHRTFEPWQGSKKRTIPIWYRSFFHESARRGSNPRPPPWQGGAPPLSHSRISYGQVIIYYRAPEMSIKKVCIFFVNCIYN